MDELFCVDSHEAKISFKKGRGGSKGCLLALDLFLLTVELTGDWQANPKLFQNLVILIFLHGGIVNFNFSQGGIVNFLNFPGSLGLVSMHGMDGRPGWLKDVPGG